MPWFPAVPPALAAADGACRINRKHRAGLPGLLHKLFIKVLRLRPASAEEYYGAYGGRMGVLGATVDEDECCYYYSYGSSWAGVLSSIPEEDHDYDYDDDSSDSEEDGAPELDVVVPDPAVLRKAKSERFLAAPHDAATVVQLEVLL